jgi:hypothetical protein
MTFAALLLMAQVSTAKTVDTPRPADPPATIVDRSSNVERTIVEPPQNDRRTVVEPPQNVRGTIVEPPQNDRRTPVERSSEWHLAAGAAKSVNLYQSASGRAYGVQTIAWARELTGDLNILGIRGRFAWGVEAMPVFAQFEPKAMYGVGLAPVVWRWNFPPRPSWSAYAELSMGGLWTTAALPEGTSQGNFTAHWGGGVRLRQRGSNALLLGYRFQHFSNGNQLGSNPGVNSHVVIAGWSRR